MLWGRLSLLAVKLWFQLMITISTSVQLPTLTAVLWHTEEFFVKPLLTYNRSLLSSLCASTVACTAHYYGLIMLYCYNLFSFSSSCEVLEGRV